MFTEYAIKIRGANERERERERERVNLPRGFFIDYFLPSQS